jgi:hypothetical protein
VRRPVQLNFTRLAGAVQYRLLVARRADFADVISETLLSTNVIVLPELENGPYFLKVRGIDDLGLEGRDTLADLVLSLDTTTQKPAASTAPETAAPAAPASPAAPTLPAAPTSPRPSQ